MTRAKKSVSDGTDGFLACWELADDGWWPTRQDDIFRMSCRDQILGVELGHSPLQIRRRGHHWRF